ncbi:MAG: hypothetical protein WC523_07200 [Patescibacteria group bacterium]
MKNKIISAINIGTKKILIISVIIILAMVLIGVYWFKRGDACLTQSLFYNCQTQNKFAEVGTELTRLSDWSLRLEQRIPNVLKIDDNEGLFTFEHIKGDGGVGWTRIMKNGEIKDSLGFYTNYIEPVLTPLSGNTLIGSAWQWPQDSKLYNGPFFNYYLDFKTRQKIELKTRGRLIAKAGDGEKVLFLESECVKNPASLEIDHGCNNQNLSLRLVNLKTDLNGKVIDRYNEIKLLDFDKVAFSPQGDKLAISAKIESIDYDTKNEYWTIFVVDTATGKIIKQNNSLAKDRYPNLYWLDNENIIYW